MSGYQYIEMRPGTDDHGREILSQFQKDLKRQVDPKLVSRRVQYWSKKSKSKKLKFSLIASYKKFLILDFRVFELENIFPITESKISRF